MDEGIRLTNVVFYSFHMSHTSLSASLKLLKWGTIGPHEDQPSSEI